MRVAVPGARHGSDAHAFGGRAQFRGENGLSGLPRGRRPRRPRVPASHVPLFQAPSLAGPERAESGPGLAG